LESNYYQLLGIQKTASIQEIKAAFKALAIKYHPDKNPGSKFHEEHFKQLSAAYEVLLDDEKRLKYDLKLMYEEQRAASLNVPRQAPPSSGRSRSGAYRGAPNYKKSTPNYKQREYNQPVKKQSAASTWFQRVGTAALVGACIIMIGIWMGNIRNQVKAKQYLSEGNYSMALNFDSSNADAYYLRAEEKEQISDYKGALKDLEMALLVSSNPEQIPSYTRKSALIYAKINELVKAESANKKVCELLPKSSKAFVELGDFYMAYTQKHELAVKAYKQAQELGNTEKTGLFEMMQVAYQSGDMEKAGLYAKMQVDIGNFEEAHFILASYYFYKFQNGAETGKNLGCEELVMAKDFEGVSDLKQKYCAVN